MDRDTSKKDRRQKVPGVSKKMDRAVEKRVTGKPGETQGAEAEAGLPPNLQAHIGRHVRAVFDEVAREPIPEHLLRLLSDLERSGDK